MKTLAFTLFLYFSLFTTNGIYAANNTLVSSYPAPSGSYNKVVIAPQATTNVNCALAINTGLVFYNTATGTLQLCASVNSQPVTVPSGETCFNRFCSIGGTTSCPNNNFSIGNNCPAGYNQATTAGGANIVDSFTASAGYTVYSTVCCTSGSTVLP